MPRGRCPIRAMAFQAVLLLSVAARAADLSVLAGATERVDDGGSSYAWQAALRQEILPNLGASIAWINEGHLEGHRRDGVAAQAWGLVPLAGGRVAIGIGAGAYHFYDTRSPAPGSYENVHGWAPIYSLAATYRTGSPWFVQLAVNHIHAPGDFDSNSYLAGIGYRLWKGPGPAPGRTPEEGIPPSRTTGYELLPFAGQVVLNRPGNPSGVVGGVEFRMGVDDHVDWTLTVLDESVPETLDRIGLGTQIWLVDAYLDGRVALGFGAGLFSFVDAERPPDSGGGRRLDIAALLTLTTSYRFSDRWFTRFHWNRVGSADDRDSDDFVLGIGYRWGR